MRPWYGWGKWGGGKKFREGREREGPLISSNKPCVPHVYTLHPSGVWVSTAALHSQLSSFPPQSCRTGLTVCCHSPPRCGVLVPCLLSSQVLEPYRKVIQAWQGCLSPLADVLFHCPVVGLHGNLMGFRDTLETRLNTLGERLQRSLAEGGRPTRGYAQQPQAGSRTEEKGERESV